MHNYKELLVWQRAINLAISIYRFTQTFPTKDQYLLSSQISRAAFSIPANIAEGSGKDTNKDFCRYLSISEGSSFELETHLIITKDILPDKKIVIEEILTELIIIQKMIYRLRIKFKPKKN
jgi:four helix bundle protein